MTTAPSVLVLVAEYNGAGGGLVRLALQDHHIECTRRVAPDGESSLEEIARIEQDSKTQVPGLLLLDMHLPNYNGEQILRLAEKHAALCYFRKPFNLSEFMELGLIIQGMLAERRAARESA